MSKKHERDGARIGSATAVGLVVGATIPADRAPDEAAQTIDAALELALTAMYENRPGDALEICEAVLSVRPGHAKALYVLVNLMHRAERRQQALGILEQAIAAEPNPPGIWLAHRGVLLTELARPQEAVSACRSALLDRPNDPDLLCALGLALKALGRSKPAVAALQRAVSRPDCQPRIHGELATALMAAGRYEKAVESYATALHRGGQPMRGRHIGVYASSTVRTWCERHEAPYRTLIGEGTGRTFLPRYAEPPGPCESVALPQPEIYLAEVANASVVGGMGVVLTDDGSALLDLALDVRSDRYDLAQPSIPYADRRAVLVDAAATADEPIEAGILLQGPASTNYYHWIVEHLPRLLVLELAGVPAQIPLLVDRAAMNVPQLVEALRAVDFAGRRVVPLTSGVEYRVERLLVPGALFWAASNLKDHLRQEVGDNLVAGEAVEFLRTRLAPAACSATGQRRLYVARRARTAGTRLVNEEAVRAVFLEFGFEAIATDTMTFDEQRELFAEAAIVASESGAALTNMLFAPASAILICLQGAPGPVNVYADLAGHMGQRSIFVAGTAESEGQLKPYQVRFSMPTDVLRGLLTRIPEAATGAVEAERPIGARS